jgi:hypothetical protein
MKPVHIGYQEGPEKKKHEIKGPSRCRLVDSERQTIGLKLN